MPENNVLALGALLFFLLATNLGIAGLVPKYMATFFPAEMRSTGIGFIYNFAAIGGGVAPVIAAKLSERVGLGSALVYVTLFWTIVPCCSRWIKIARTYSSSYATIKNESKQDQHFR